MYKNDLEIDVGRCMRALIKRVSFTFLMALLSFITGVGLTLNPEQDKYSAVATVYAATDGNYSDATNAVTAMNAYLNVASSYKICQRAALIIGRADVSAEDLQAATSVSTSAKASKAATTASFMNSSATIISFYSSSTDPELSMEMADAMAQSYALEMNDILNKESVKVLDNAYTYSKSYNADFEAWKVRILFGIVGFILACLIVIFCEILDTKVRTVREATIRGNIPVIGIIPDYKD